MWNRFYKKILSISLHCFAVVVFPWLMYRRIYRSSAGSDVVPAIYSYALSDLSQISREVDVKI